MKPYLDENFLLETPIAVTLYHRYAKKMPIMDYHSHLSAQAIAEDAQFTCIGEAWLATDHYKWRAMRANGIKEDFITGDESFKNKFMKWAETVPQTLRNPLHHWTHLELQRYFDIDELLSPKTAESIYERCNDRLRSAEYSARKCLERMNVKLVCTTDDPSDDLVDHKAIRESHCPVAILPTFRPDRAMDIGESASYFNYLSTLGAASGIEISNYNNLIEALQRRHDFFHREGCRLSDHGLSQMPSVETNANEVEGIFRAARQGTALGADQVDRFKGAVLVELAKMNHQKSWAQQYHLGALRGNNPKLLASYGPDSGGDSIADLPQAQRLSSFLAHLEREDKLTKTIVYNLNPKDNESVATMIGNFQDATIPGKMQFGSAWWFLDQKKGMEDQIDVLSRQGLITRFIGMLTDSRSLLSYPRHEYFRRILCNLIGNDVDRGEIPWDEEQCGAVVQDICFNNAKSYFSFEHALGA